MARLPIGAVQAIAEAEARAWWSQCGCVEFSGLDFARHRQEIEVPRARIMLERLRALPKADRAALASALMSGPSSTRLHDDTVRGEAG